MLNRLIPPSARLPQQEQLKRGNSHDSGAFLARQCAVSSRLSRYSSDLNLEHNRYLILSSVFLVGSAFTLAKTVRDEHEARRLASRIDEARTEKLLMEVGRR